MAVMGLGIKSGETVTLTVESGNGEANAAIFEIHQMMLEGEDYLDVIKRSIQTQGASAKHAAEAAGENFSAAFSSMEDEYMRASAFGTVSIMFPMTISIREVRDAEELLDECRAELTGRGLWQCRGPAPPPS